MRKADADDAPLQKPTMRNTARRIGWPKTLRGRLSLIYTIVAAIVLAVLVSVFLLQFRDALVNGLDRSLDTRAASSVAALQEAAAPDFPDPQTSGTSASGINAFTVVYDPSGSVVSTAPSNLDVLPITATQRTTALKSPLRGDTTITNVRYRFYAVAVARTDGTWLVVSVANYYSIDQSAAAVTRVLLVGMPLLLLLVGFGAWILSGLSLRAVGRMRAEAAELGAQDASGRITEPSAAELKELAQTFNRLLDRLHQSVIHQRNLVADAGHELRTPLTVLRTELELAHKPGRTREELADSVHHARKEVERLAELTESVLFLARADQGAAISSAASVNVKAIITEAASAHDRQCAQAQIDLNLRCAADLVVIADPSALRRAIDNLLSNALDHTPDHGAIRIEADGSADGTDVTICVADTGPGFPADFLPYAFERFRKADAARVRPPTGGSGLGLAIVQEIAALHGGIATARNLPDGGAQVVITIPTIIELH